VEARPEGALKKKMWLKCTANKCTIEKYLRGMKLLIATGLAWPDLRL